MIELIFRWVKLLTSSSSSFLSFFNFLAALYFHICGDEW